jgi:hypothetical protein
VSFTHAVVAPDGAVDRITAAPDATVVPQGHTVVALAEPLSGWPAGPAEGALQCSPDGTLSWVDVRTLAQAQAQAWERIKLARAAHIDAGIVTPYGAFQTAPPERQNIAEGVLLARTLTDLGQPVSIAWTLADNTVVTLDATAMVNVGLLLGSLVQQAHATARTLRAAVDAATTIEEADAVQWPQE